MFGRLTNPPGLNVLTVVGSDGDLQPGIHGPFTLLQ
jgi:hypothetical protein